MWEIIKAYIVHETTPDCWKKMEMGAAAVFLIWYFRREATLHEAKIRVAAQKILGA